ncbi:hypothetical protein DFP72DRAFT_817188, partial [Ephemerocybe angulata]
ATSDDDPEKVHNWRTYTMPCDSLTIPARFIEPLDPEVHTGPKPFYLFKTPFLIAQTSLLIQRLSSSDLVLLPKLKRTLDYPYREEWGELLILHLVYSSCHPRHVSTLDMSAPRIIEHVGAHILFDSTVSRTDEPCGLCSLPAKQCRYIVVKGQGSKVSKHVNWKRTTGCARPVNFSYKRTLEYSDNSPCTNVPLVCPLCEADEPAIWCYNFRFHLEQKHLSEAVARYKSQWDLSSDEMAGMQQI